MRYVKLCLLLPLLATVTTLDVRAQDPDDPWSGSFGAGLSLTGGNTDTANYNLSFEGVRDPKSRHVLKLNGLYLRADQDEEKTADRLRLAVRNEYTLSDRTFTYFDVGYLRDPFKEISYLVNPQGGIGYKLYATDSLSLEIDGGAGMVWEKNLGQEVLTDGSINAGQALKYQIAEGTALVQRVAGLWKMDDFEDALYSFSVGLATRLTSRTELKVEFIDDFKNKPPNPDVKKNDTAFLTSFLFNF